MKPNPPPLRSLWLPIYLPSFLMAAGLGAVIPVTPLFAKELGAGVGLAGLAVAMRGVGTMALDVPAGLLIARVPDRRVMLWGGLGTCAVALATWRAGSVLALVALLFAVGATISLWSMSRLHFMAEQIPPEVRGRAMAMLGGTGRLGLFVGPTLGGFLASRHGLASAFLVQAALSATAVALLALGFARLRERSALRASAPAHGGPSARAVLVRVVREERRGLLGAGSVAIVLQVLRNARHFLLPVWGDAIGLDVARIGLVVGLSSGLDMLLFHVAGQIMDRRGRRATGVPSLALLSLGLALLPLTDGFGGLLAVGLLVGLGNGLSAGFVMTLGADLAPEEGRSQFLGVWRLIGDVGSAAGPLLVGAVAQLVTLGVAAVATAGLGLLGALAMAGLVGETLRRPPDP